VHPLALERVKSTLAEFPFAPPIQVDVKGASPHVALYRRLVSISVSRVAMYESETDLAAATQPSQRPLLISIVPEVAVRLKRAVPLAPVVLVGCPPHCCIVPAMPPQMERRAT
jgi:hypothetical protein